MNGRSEEQRRKGPRECQAAVDRGASLALLAAWLIGCATGPEVKPTMARLQVISVPAAASVYVDGHYFGRARVLAEVPEPLKPGKHLVTIMADDHFPHDVELDLAPGTTTVRVELRPIPP